MCIVIVALEMKNAYYYTAHKGWDITSYQGLFYPLNKPACDRLSGGVQVLKVVVGIWSPLQEK